MESLPVRHLLESVGHEPRAKDDQQSAAYRVGEQAVRRRLGPGAYGAHVHSGNPAAMALAATTIDMRLKVIKTPSRVVA